MKKILFICPYPLNKVASQRFRFEQYFPALSSQGFEVEVQPLFTESDWRQIKEGSLLTQFLISLKGTFSRVGILFKIHRFDFVFIHREALPFGPPLLEWIICRMFKKHVVYDFDDAIWMTDNTNESFVMKWLRCRSKVASICRWSYKVSVGNRYLAEFAQAYNDNVVVNPTTIDTVNVHNPTLYPNKDFLKNKNAINGKVIGWTGSFSTLKYLEQLYPVIEKLHKKIPDVTILVIADQPPKPGLPNLIFKRWSKLTEALDLAMIDVGIMPLPDDEWTKGKCGFKALQYMSMEVPAVVSPVGVNTTIIANGVNGFLCSNDEEWLNHLTLLLQDEYTRSKTGKAGRQTVVEHYSVAANTSNFLSLFH